MRHLASILLVLLVAAAPCRAEKFTGKVVEVDDGDTINVLHDGEGETIRLNGIDCPEKTQMYGKKARKFTSDRVLDKVVTVDVVGMDKYGRSIGDVFLEDGTSLNHELVKEGLAWWYFKHSKDEALKALELEAREAKRGLWRDPIPIPPWVFRKIQQKTVPEVADFQYPGTVGTGILANKRSKVYRQAACKGYEAMLDQKNAIPFETVDEAEEAG